MGGRTGSKEGATLALSETVRESEGVVSRGGCMQFIYTAKSERDYAFLGGTPAVHAPRGVLS